MTLRLLETTTRVTPLGLRFWDLAANTVVNDGLMVSAYPPDQPWRAKQSLVNPSGVHVLQDLFGLRELESGTGDKAFWDGLTSDQRRDFILEVEDSLGRFLPFACRVKLPVRGLLRLQEILPLEAGNVTALKPEQLNLSPDAVVLPLFSNPARRIPAGMAAIRASLHDTTTNTPAAWAAFEIHLDNTASVLARGFADASGQLLVLMPYPKLRDLAQPPPLEKHFWPLEIRLRYTPVQSLNSLNARELPDLYRLLTQALTQDLIEENLEFGQELIVKSPGSSSLNIAPA